MSQSVFCIASTHLQVERIALSLKDAGFSAQAISVLLPDQSGARDFGHEQHSKASEAGVAGAGAGGLLGGGLGWLVGIGALAIPGVGAFIAAGPIMAALAGAALGAAAGGLTGSLVGLGIPEYVAKQYEGKIHAGNMLMSVHAEDSTQVDEAKRIFEQEGATDISSAQETTVRAAA